MYINDEFIARVDNLDYKLEQCFDAQSVFAEENKKCGCGSSTPNSRWGLKGYPLSMVYSPYQEWSGLYDMQTGLSRGTIFKELDLPFEGCKGCGGVHNA